MSKELELASPRQTAAEVLSAVRANKPSKEIAAVSGWDIHLDRSNNKQEVVRVVPTCVTTLDQATAPLGWIDTAAAVFSMLAIFGAVFSIVADKWLWFCISLVSVLVFRLVCSVSSEMVDDVGRIQRRLLEEAGKTYADPLIVAFLKRLPRHSDTNPAMLVNILWRLSQSEHLPPLNADNSFVGKVKSLVKTAIQPRPNILYDDMLRLMEDDDFADDVVNVVRLLAATDNPMTLNKARRTVEHLVVEQAYARQQLLEVQPDFQGDMTALVDRHRLQRGANPLG